MPARWFVDDVDLQTECSFYVDDAPNWDDGAALPQELLAMPHLLGGVPAGVVQGEARSLRFAGVVNGSSVADTRTKTERLIALVARGLSRHVIDDEVNPPREIDALYTGHTRPRYYGHPFIQPAARVELRFSAPNAMWRAVDPTAVTLSATRARCPLGTGPSAPLLVLFGNASSPVTWTVKVRNAAGDVVSTTVFTGTALGASDFLEVDCGAQTLVKSVSGTRTSAVSYYSSGPWPLLDGADGRYDAASWPSLELTTNVGTAGGLAIYRRMFL
jgi:hypothetical protein